MRLRKECEHGGDPPMPNPREALEAALADDWHHRTKRKSDLVDAAARKQLALMSEVCGTCGATPGTVDVIDGFADCPTCHGSGKVYPQETVEKISRILYDWEADKPAGFIKDSLEEFAIAVLDALGETE